MAPITTVLVEYGHLLIGLSLLFGLMVRVSASAGVFFDLLPTEWVKTGEVLRVHADFKGFLVNLAVIG
jgi:hypothetical protein